MKCREANFHLTVDCEKVTHTHTQLVMCVSWEVLKSKEEKEANKLNEFLNKQKKPNQHNA